MTIKERLDEIDHLQQTIAAHGKINEEILRKINYKFRLEWNYYSNRMEGNTLTIDETKGVMVGNINVKDKPLKDVMEMRGHDEAIKEIIRMGKGDLNISEGRIKKLHQAIMYEEDADKRNQLGKWKTTNNHILNYRGEKFEFTDSGDVSEKMHDLLNWYNVEKDKIKCGDEVSLHPILLACMFHLRYLTIHPFYDGNGRTARILTNLILISYGYPPFYVMEKEKDTYYRYLAEVQAYCADENLLYAEIAGYIKRSMKIVLDAIEGRSIEEADDFVKEIELLKDKLANAVVPKSPKLVKTIFDKIENDFWKPLDGVLSHFDSLFNESKTVHNVNGWNEQFEKKNLLDREAMVTSAEPSKPKIFGYDVYEGIKTVEWRQTKYGLKGAPGEEIKVSVSVIFGTEKYQLDVQVTGPPEERLFLKKIYFVEKQYGESITIEDVESAKGELKKQMLETIKAHVAK